MGGMKFFQSVIPLLSLAGTLSLSAADVSATDVPATKDPLFRETTLPPSAPSETQPYALNVIYFLPAGTEPFENYETRLSGILLALQRFYLNEMERNGHPGRTFGLNKSEDGTKVNIVVVRGEADKSAYPYEGGAGRARKEIQKFFEENPDKKFSDHSLVIMPSTTENPLAPGGVPFYGFGKICFALDYPDFDIKHCGKNDKLGALFTKWFGGMAHELGHGMNLPHNRGTKTQEKNFGTALMGAGNYTLGRRPTFLTPASCAILDRCQIFRTEKFEGPASPRIKKPDEIAIRFGKQSVRVSGRLPKNHRVVSVVVYYDKDECWSVNADYDAETFIADFNREDGVFTAEIPFDEIHPGKTPRVQIRMRLIHDDGECSILRYTLPKDLFIPENTPLKELAPSKG